MSRIDSVTHILTTDGSRSHLASEIIGKSENVIIIVANTCLNYDARGFGGWKQAWANCIHA